MPLGVKSFERSVLDGLRTSRTLRQDRRCVAHVTVRLASWEMIIILILSHHLKILLFTRLSICQRPTELSRADTTLETFRVPGLIHRLDTLLTIIFSSKIFDKLLTRIEKICIFTSDVFYDTLHSTVYTSTVYSESKSVRNFQKIV